MKSRIPPGTVETETIAAVATPPGRGGVGIVRISGPLVQNVARALIKPVLKPRYAMYCDFLAEDNSVIDQGIVLYFPAPHSFTGEDVLELQGHGGPVVLEMLLTRVTGLGARIARPGEFSERAFLNNKLDLSQAEAIADLIDSASQQAAKSAVKSLQGEFSKKIQSINENITALRMHVEAAIDFPEEEIDFLSDEKISDGVQVIGESLTAVLQQASKGVLLREGITLVLAGRPNAGKSSLMNLLSGKDAAIVTHIAGTTRDLINEYINLDGVPLKLVDTAGIRAVENEVEEQGVRRALAEIEYADGVLLLIDLNEYRDWSAGITDLLEELPDNDKVIIILNKVDLVDEMPDVPVDFPYPVIPLSAKLGTGHDELLSKIKQIFALDLSGEGSFIARTRHIDALNRALNHLRQGKEQLSTHHAGELLAEELRLSHESLGEITGDFSSDDLLGRIFSSFCIGK